MFHWEKSQCVWLLAFLRRLPSRWNAQPTTQPSRPIPKARCANCVPKSRIYAPGWTRNHPPRPSPQCRRRRGGAGGPPIDRTRQFRWVSMPGGIPPGDLSFAATMAPFCCIPGHRSVPRRHELSSDQSAAGGADTENGFELPRMKLILDGNIFTTNLTYQFIWATDDTSGDLGLQDAWARYHFQSTPFAIERVRFAIRSTTSNCSSPPNPSRPTAPS